MSSQKSTTRPAGIRVPTRQRGRLRVAALLDAAATVFAARGYDAATMTEIAAAAKAAIGSLYQFFPSKDSLADALVTRYVERLDEALRALAGGQAGRPARELADGFIDVMLDLGPERTAAIALLDARSITAAERLAFRDAARLQIAEVLKAALPLLPEERAAAMAGLILLVLKSVPALAEEDMAAGTAFIAEARAMLRAYIAQGIAT